MHRKLSSSVLAALIATALPARAEEHSAGEVRVPLATYHGLVEAMRERRDAPSFAIGEASITVAVQDASAGASVEVIAELPIRTASAERTYVPILPPGTALASAMLDGAPIELAAGADGLAAMITGEGAHKLRLSYHAAVQRSGAGFVLAFPLPPATSSRLSATITGAGLDASVVPAAGRVAIGEGGESTAISAVIPPSAGVLIAWRAPSEAREGHAVSRARWSGVLAGDAVRWRLVLDADVFAAEAEIPVVPSSLALAEVTVDGKPATIIAGEESFAALVKGRGRHQIVAELAVPVVRADGPPHVALSLVPVPMSRFELELPGKKEVTAEPAANVTLTSRANATLVQIQAPMTAELRISWSEAVPEDARADARANAAVHHLFHVDEGVLHATAYVAIEVTRGETNVLELEIPDDVQVNSITSPSGAVSDWRIARTAPGKASRATVFLDRKVKGELMLEARYERLIGGGPDATDIIGVPLVKMLEVQRQRGMIALLQSTEVSLKPIEEAEVTKVGENALPPFVREKISMTVAQAYKYVEGRPRVSVQTVAPERKQGRFDAAIDTLVSISDVTLRGASSIAIDVKSGKLMVLELTLPADADVLNVAAPSLRAHRVKTEGGVQKVEVQFTQEMEGQFAVDLGFERILAEPSGKTSETVVPDVSVSGAEVVQGRIAVEALAAAKVQAARAERVSMIDPAALPRRLVLRTTNPILLAYEYVRSDPAPVLALRVDRHAKVETQVATIDSASYETLYLGDGLAVTTARYQVRNTRKQFLELELPEGSEVWSAVVDGKAEKPALAERKVLVQVISSTRGFLVELVYATKIPEIRGMGTIEGVLPRTDMVVTETRWDVYLPDGLSYETPTSNLQLTSGPRDVPRSAFAAASEAPREGQQPLRITVPMTGIAYSFEKLYASQSEQAPHFAIDYASAGWRGVGRTLWVLGVLTALIAAAIGLRRYGPRLRKMAHIGA